MACQTIPPQPGDLANERGQFGSTALPGEEPMAPDTGADASAGREAGADTGATPRIGTEGAAIEDLADPGADANVPEPSKPVAMGVGPGLSGTAR